jgi:hypothetical protein
MVLADDYDDDYEEATVANASMSEGQLVAGEVAAVQRLLKQILHYSMRFEAQCKVVAAGADDADVASTVSTPSTIRPPPPPTTSTTMATTRTTTSSSTRERRDDGPHQLRALALGLANITAAGIRQEFSRMPHIVGAAVNDAMERVRQELMQVPVLWIRPLADGIEARMERMERMLLEQVSSNARRLREYEQTASRINRETSQCRPGPTVQEVESAVRRALEFENGRAAGVEAVSAVHAREALLAESRCTMTRRCSIFANRSLLFASPTRNKFHVSGDGRGLIQAVLAMSAFGLIVLTAIVLVLLRGGRIAFAMGTEVLGTRAEVRILSSRLAVIETTQQRMAETLADLNDEEEDEEVGGGGADDHGGSGRGGANGGSGADGATGGDDVGSGENGDDGMRQSSSVPSQRPLATSTPLQTVKESGKRLVRTLRSPAVSSDSGLANMLGLKSIAE